jgi:hypothetical protein
MRGLKGTLIIFICNHCPCEGEHWPHSG